MSSVQTEQSGTYEHTHTHTHTRNVSLFPLSLSLSSIFGFLVMFALFSHHYFQWTFWKGYLDHQIKTVVCKHLDVTAKKLLVYYGTFCSVGLCKYFQRFDGVLIRSGDSKFSSCCLFQRKVNLNKQVKIDLYCLM